MQIIWRPPWTILFFIFLLIVKASLWIGTYFDDDSIPQKHQNSPQEIIFPLNSTIKNQIQTCPINYPKTPQTRISSSKSTCPDYFRWIHEDLMPWNNTGITKDMVERANRTAHFRLVIINNKVYIEKYHKPYQTRDVFTIWGILQLLKIYPGRLPDLELMFDCEDQPVVQSSDYSGPNMTSPPPLFRYGADRWTMDIVFPDWTFWGWAELNIQPWNNLLREMKEGNNRIKWLDREPYAYWKGSFHVSESRMAFRKCNVSDKQDWNARLYSQNWNLESQQGFKQSNVASQCTHRYKIYVEGWGWSVSKKYILACDSMTLLVKPRYHDFFSRCLQPLQHYWPIREDEKCKSIKFAVDWGNNHKQKAQEIGKAASKFIQEEVKMKYVYDYMFHLLNEYAKLLKFKPTLTDGAVEVCSESMASLANGSERKFMMESLVKGPSITSPCTMPPHEPKILEAFLRKKVDAIRQVQDLENRYWKIFNSK